MALNEEDQNMITLAQAHLNNYSVPTDDLLYFMLAMVNI